MFFIAALLYISSVSAQNTTQSGETFSRNLRQGDRGEDVQNLQKVLNQSPETRIAEEGPGARGEETTYFGGLTKDAVMRFQEKYAAEILFPVGLVRGTGFVGSMTRKKLNEIGGAASISVPIQGGGNQTLLPQSVKPKIISISPEKGLNGTTITIHGEGFTPTDNTVTTTLLTPSNLFSSDGKTIEFKFYSDVVNKMVGIDSLKGQGVTRDELVSLREEIRINSPEHALPAGRSLSVPMFITVSNKNGTSNSMQFEVDFDAVNYLTASTTSAKADTRRQFSLIEKVMNFAMNHSGAQIAEAKLSWSDIIFFWQGIANQIWGAFLGGGSGGGGSSVTGEFGGNVIYSLPCLCSASTAFMIAPVHGSPGPYNVSWYSTAIKMNYRPFIPYGGGYWVLGSAVQGGVCVMYVGVSCYTYNASEILPAPGVGSSLTI